jgi:microcystin-dependent protein
MSRQAYAEVITYVEPTGGSLHPAGNAEVSVYLAGTGTLATIYEGREGGSPSSNPFIVPSTGLSNKGDVSWTQEGSGAWVPQLNGGVVGLTELANSAFIPGTRLTTGTQQQLLETGDVKSSAVPTAPTGWLMCNGASKLRSEYEALFGKIGTTYGSVDGTHFTLPDLRGRGPVGPDGGAGRITASNALGQAGGEEKHTLTITELAVHGHFVNINSNASGDHAHGLNAANAYGGGGGAAVTGEGGGRATSPAGNHSHNSQGWSNNEGGGGPHNNLSPYQVLNFMIKT